MNGQATKQATGQAAGEPNLAGRLAAVQTLLLSPGPEAMREVERHLTYVIEQVREGSDTLPGPRPNPSDLGNSVRSIKFLLDRAKQFWDRRRLVIAPGVQYSAGGAVVDTTSTPTFAFEV